MSVGTKSNCAAPLIPAANNLAPLHLLVGGGVPREPARLARRHLQVLAGSVMPDRPWHNLHSITFPRPAA